jgi:hypothetical protein
MCWEAKSRELEAAPQTKPLSSSLRLVGKNFRGTGVRNCGIRHARTFALINEVQLYIEEFVGFQGEERGEFDRSSPAVADATFTRNARRSVECFDRMSKSPSLLHYFYPAMYKSVTLPPIG